MIYYNVPPHCEWCDDPAEQVVELTREEAIVQQREAGLTKGYIYATDEMALDDFMSVHWAWEE